MYGNRGISAVCDAEKPLKLLLLVSAGSPQNAVK